jgi:hypothetical protein
MDLELNCSSVGVSPTYSSKTVSVSVENANDGDILDHFKIEDIISHFGYDKFLDEIGEERVKEYFDLTEKTEE